MQILSKEINNTNLLGYQTKMHHEALHEDSNHQNPLTKYNDYDNH